MNIKFTNTFDVSLSNREPIPASKNVPDWYKNLESYVGGVKKPSGEGNTTGTIKRCVPVFDAITAGYLISTIVDVYVSQRDGHPWYEWSSLSPISWHPLEQAPTHPDNHGHAVYPKWINPWSIKTPKGYSCLFLPPMHRDNSIFTILSGVVDTDTYFAPVNFPFVLNDTKFEGMIPAGTPMAQVIPFKRDSWSMEFGNIEDVKKQAAVSDNLRYTFFDSYKKRFWHKKEFK